MTTFTVEDNPLLNDAIGPLVIKINDREWNVTSRNGNEIFAISQPSTGKEHKVTLLLDGIENDNHNVTFSYTRPNITRVVVPPPVHGGNMEIAGSDFGTVTDLISIEIDDNNCARSCLLLSDQRFLPSNIKCNYAQKGQPKDCNRTVRIIVDNQASDWVPFCYDATRGELQGIPDTVVQRLKEGTSYEYPIKLVDALVHEKPVKVLINITATNANGMEIDPSIACAVSNSSVIFPANQKSVFRITVTAMENNVDEGMDKTAFECFITHTVISDDDQYKSVPSKSLKVVVVNDDVSDIKLWIYDTQKKQFDLGVKFIGPLCNREGENSTYGVKLATEPHETVTVKIMVDLQVNGTWLNPGIFPNATKLIVRPSVIYVTHFNWNYTQSVMLFSLNDDIDNDDLRFRIRHEVETNDAHFMKNPAVVKETIVMMKVEDDDLVGLDYALPRRQQSLKLIEDGNMSTITIFGLHSQPLRKVIVYATLVPSYKHADLFKITAPVTIEPDAWRNLSFTIGVRALRGVPRGESMNNYIMTKLILRTSSADPKYNLSKGSTSYEIDVQVMLVKRELKVYGGVKGFIDEGQVYAYNIGLSEPPVSNVFMQIHILGNTSNCSINGTSQQTLIIKPGDWSQGRRKYQLFIQALDNDVDEGGKGHVSDLGICTIQHTLRTNSTSTYDGLTKTLTLHIVNNDIARYTVRGLIKESSLGDVYHDGVTVLGPLCLYEGENISYGVQFKTKPRHPVRVQVNIKLPRTDTPMILRVYPDSFVLDPNNWKFTHKVVIECIRDFVDNVFNAEEVEIHHHIVTNDTVFNRTVYSTKAVITILRVTDHEKDVAGIILSKSVVVINERESQGMAVVAFNTIPQSSVTISVSLLGIPTDENGPLLSVAPPAISIPTGNWRQVVTVGNSSNFCPIDGEECTYFTITSVAFTVQSQEGDYCRPNNDGRCTVQSDSFHLQIDSASNDLPYNESRVSKDVTVAVKEAEETEAPERPALWVGVSMKELKMSWALKNTEKGRLQQEEARDKIRNWDEFEVQLSASEFFPPGETNSTKQRFPYDGKNFYYNETLHRALSDVVIYVRVKKIGNPNSGWSTLSERWVVASQCDHVRQYLNTSHALVSWRCEECPAGGDCVGSDVTWKEVRPLFGWWRVGVWEAFKPSAFAKCFYPPACMGAANVAYQGSFIDDDGKDLAMANSGEQCSPALGFAQQCDRDADGRCRLCSTCAAGFRRRSVGGALRCDTCPPTQANKWLILLGILLVFLVVGLMVFNHMGEGGKKSRSQMRKVIIINYLQTTFMIANMDVPWPDSLSGLFEFTGAVSTVGEQLLNPECEMQAFQAADVAFSKQVGYAFIVPLLGSCVFFMWRVAAVVLGRRFTYRGPDGASPSLKDGFVATMVFLMYLMYPTLCRQAFALFMCHTVGDRSYMMADLQEPCWVGRHIFWVTFCSIPQIVLHVIGFPLLGLIMVYRRKKIVMHNHDKSFSGLRQIKMRNNLTSTISLFKFGMLYSAYGPDRWYWDAIIAFKKASIAFLTSFVTTPELEVHWVVAMTGSFILLNEFGQPYNNPRELERLRDAALRDREKTLRLPKQQKGLSKYGSGTNGRLSDIKVRLNVVDPGTELQRLDSLTCYVSMVTAWSGLFFILFPYCSDNEIGCATLLVSVMAINVAFLVYCVLLFRVEIVSESRRVCRLICTRCGKSALHATPEKEVSEVELRRVKNSVHGNPLLYRKSFVAYQNTVNPLQVALEKSEGVILQLRTSKAKAYSRRSEKIKRLIHARQGKKKNSHGADDFEWARVIKGDGSETYYYNPRTGEKRKNDPRKDWVRAKDEDGNAYYYHTVTNEVRWNIFEDGTHGWVEAIDQAGNQYFHHPGTGETSWTDPRDPWEYSVDEETGKAFYCHIRTGETHWINEVDSSGEEIAYEDNPMRHEPHTSQNVEEDSRVSLQDNPMRHEI